MVLGRLNNHLVGFNWILLLQPFLLHFPSCRSSYLGLGGIAIATYILLFLQPVPKPCPQITFILSPYSNPMIFFSATERFAWPVSLFSYCLLPLKKQDSKKHQYYIFKHHYLSGWLGFSYDPFHSSSQLMQSKT